MSRRLRKSPPSCGLVTNGRATKTERRASLVIVTAPHAVCQERNVDGHWERTGCDTLALPAANKITKALSTYHHIQVKTLWPTTARHVCDLNRPVCRHMAYRRQLETMVQSAVASGRYHKVVVLDVHSFNGNGLGRVGSVANGRSLLLLDRCKAHRRSHSFVSFLIDQLDDKRVGAFCSTLGDIRSQVLFMASRLRTRTPLHVVTIEFNSWLLVSELEQWTTKLAKIVARFCLR